MSVKSLKSYLLSLSLLLSIPVLGLIYTSLNHEGEKTHNLVTDFDRQLPFIKWFVLPYLGWYLFLFAAFLYLAFKNREAYYSTLIQFNIGLLLCYGVYAVYQTYVPRPELSGDDGLLQLVQWVYKSDAPFNCFPSTHVLTSYLMMKAYLHTANIPRVYAAAVAMMSLLIIASTQFMKQHVLFDIIGAVLVAEGVIFAVKRLQKSWSGRPQVSGAPYGTMERSLK